eukprot:353939-Chlamydomonas_euryale.AAC.38
MASARPPRQHCPPRQHGPPRKHCTPRKHGSWRQHGLLRSRGLRGQLRLKRTTEGSRAAEAEQDNRGLDRAAGALEGSWAALKQHG